MRSFRVILFVILLLPFLSKGQKIQYSRQTFPHSFADATQLVADVGGYHHILRFKLNNRPRIHIFNSQLEYTGEAEVDISVEEGSDIRVIPMEGHYYLYLHTPGKPIHSVYRVSSTGDVIDKTAQLKKMTDSLVPKSTATYQFESHQNRLCLLSHSYYDDIKRVGSIVVVLDNEWNIVNRAILYYPFTKGKETLRQVLLTDRDLIVLKTGRDYEQGNTLQVVKTNLKTGTSLIKTFVAESHMYSNALMVYAAGDSSLLVHALMREESPGRRQTQPIFLARLDHQLLEHKPFTVFRLPPKRNILAGFLLVKTEKPFWLTPYNPIVLRGVRNQTQDFRGIAQDERTLRMSTNTMLIDENEINHGQPTSIRFTVLNENDRQIRDTTVENNRSFYDLQPRPNAQFSIGDKTCLLFQQNFSAKQRGLVLVNSNAAGHVSTTPIPVFDRNEYFIPQTQAKKDYFLLPYRYKKEMGLVKITIESIDH